MPADTRDPEKPHCLLAHTVRLASYPIKVDSEVNWDELMRLARKHRLTAYDASYLELAIRSRAPVATLDGALQRAAANEGVALGAIERDPGLHDGFRRLCHGDLHDRFTCKCM